jgi:hypothetical protein
MILRNLVVVLIAAVAGPVETVRVSVVGETVPVMTRPSPSADVVATASGGAVLDVLNKEGRWYWVLIDRDAHGTQRAGWIREADVRLVGQPEPEPANAPAAAVAPPPAEKPRKVDDRRLKDAERQLEKARREFERLQER